MPGKTITFKWLWVLMIIFILSCQKEVKQIRVACVGDSITEGYGIVPESRDSYPSLLKSLLGDSFSVLNAGRSGATLQKAGNRPYWETNEFANVFEFQPNTIIIKLGTNDTKPINWKNTDIFANDYQALIDTFLTITPTPEIILCTPSPVFESNWGINDSTLKKGIIPVINKIAISNELPLVDFYQNLINQQDKFPDHIHPNADGARVIATTIAKELVEN